MLEVALLHRSIRLRENVKGDLRDETMDGIYCVNAFVLGMMGMAYTFIERNKLKNQKRLYAVKLRFTLTYLIT